MTKSLVKRRKARAPAKKKIEPLTRPRGRPRSTEEIGDWLKRYDRLPVKEKNQAIEENRIFAQVLESQITNGSLLRNPLKAESEEDPDQAEHTFLSILKPLRERLAKEYEVKTAAEFMLLDMIVLSYYQYLRAASALHGYVAFGKSYDYEILVRYAQAYLDRANQIFLRNIQALREMKAAPLVVKIEQAGQVNVGEKQVNVAGDVSAGGPKPAGAVVDAAAIALPEAGSSSDGAPGRISVPQKARARASRGGQK